MGVFEEAMKFIESCIEPIPAYIHYEDMLSGEVYITDHGYYVIKGYKHAIYYVKRFERISCFTSTSNINLLLSTKEALLEELELVIHAGYDSSAAYYRELIKQLKPETNG
jgi:hypothetical protein